MEVVPQFIARLDGILAAGGVSTIKRAVEAGHTGMPPDASLMDQPRLIVCLEGRANFSFEQSSGAVEVGLPARAGLFVAPGHWVKAQPHRPYVSMGVVFYPRATRFYLIQARPARNRPLPAEPSETCTVPIGLSEEGRALCRLLAGSPPAVAAERFFRNAGECLLVAARGLLAEPPAENVAGKARFTWQAACDFMADNLHRPLSRKDVARYLRVHPNHVSRLFAEHSREPFAVFLQNQRLARARLLLTDPRLNVAEVARLSGFGSASYFIRLFRTRHRLTPTRMRGR